MTGDMPTDHNRITIRWTFSIGDVVVPKHHDLSKHDDMYGVVEGREWYEGNDIIGEWVHVRWHEPNGEPYEETWRMHFRTIRKRNT